MPSTRKKIIKTVYEDDDDSEADKAAGDFSDSGSEAQISEQSSSEDDQEPEVSSADEFDEKSKKKLAKSKPVKKKTKFAKQFINKINKQVSLGSDNEADIAPESFSVKDLTDADKLLPSVLNLSESDSSEDESPKPVKKQTTTVPINLDSDSETESKQEYKDVWSHYMPDNSEEIAQKTFMALEQHKAKIEETKASLLNYQAKYEDKQDFDVKDLLAQGEEMGHQVQGSETKKKKSKTAKDDSDSDMEDWEEVKETKGIPQRGLQLVVGIPDAVYKKNKTLDIEMMMKRKINRVKKENQVYMHKVHVLCWLGHGNFVSQVLNDQDILAVALSLVPSKECYPGDRVDMKYVEQITTWYKDKLTLKQDKYEDKFRPKAPPLKEILLKQIKSRVVTTKKYLVFIFVSMLRALGLQCRVMFNFVTLPIKPPTSELCSLSTKTKEDKASTSNQNKGDEKKELKNRPSTSKSKSTNKIPQVDGIYDESESDIENIMQLDGNDDVLVDKRSTRSTRATKNSKKSTTSEVNEDVSPPKRARKSPSPRSKSTKTAAKQVNVNDKMDVDLPQKTSNKKKHQEKLDNNPTNSCTENKQVVRRSPNRRQTSTESNRKKEIPTSDTAKMEVETNNVPSISSRKIPNAKNGNKKADKTKSEQTVKVAENKTHAPEIIITDENQVASKYFDKETAPAKKLSLSRKRPQTALPSTSQKPETDEKKKTKSRTRSTPGSAVEKSKYFNEVEEKSIKPKTARQTKQDAAKEDAQRVSHKDLLAKNKPKPKNDVREDLIGIMKSRVKEAFQNSKRGKVKGKDKKEHDDDEDSDYLPVESPKRPNSASDEDFKPTKISPRPSTSRSRKIDRRVLSSDDETPSNKSNVWCEIYVEELEQWICVDVIKGKVHCTNEIFTRATHPVCYIVGWDNNNYLKDVTRRYVPHWNTVTRKQREGSLWWDISIRPWLGPKSARDKEEDEQLQRMQLEAPLPKSIGEYKNHPLYALKRHLLKFEAIYPPDAATLGFVRSEAVYARECIYICRSRDTWLKEAKVVRLGEQPYKIVKARPKWDRLSNKLITDKPLEVFGPWQVQDYEPPLAENGIVPRNAYGNVELFKDCMLPKGTVHVKLPGLNRVAKKLNIDCAPAMTGFDFNGGWSHPVFDGFVVCKEFEEVITAAWLEDQEDQERREREKIETRVYGNWRRLIKGLFIRERLKNKYGFQDPAVSASQEKKRKGPRLVVKKK